MADTGTRSNHAQYPIHPRPMTDQQQGPHSLHHKSSRMPIVLCTHHEVHGGRPRYLPPQLHYVCSYTLPSSPDATLSLPLRPVWETALMQGPPHTPSRGGIPFIGYHWLLSLFVSA